MSQFGQQRPYGKLYRLRSLAGAGNAAIVPPSATRAMYLQTTTERAKGGHRNPHRTGVGLKCSPLRSEKVPRKNPELGLDLATTGATIGATVRHPVSYTHLRAHETRHDL